jgi:hypothetical protein
MPGEPDEKAVPLFRRELSSAGPAALLLPRHVLEAPATSHRAIRCALEWPVDGGSTRTSRDFSPFRFVLIPSPLEESVPTQVYSLHLAAIGLKAV